MPMPASLASPSLREVSMEESVLLAGCVRFFKDNYSNDDNNSINNTNANNKNDNNSIDNNNNSNNNRH